MKRPDLEGAAAGGLVKGEDIPVPAVHAAQRVKDGAALVGRAGEGEVCCVAVGLGRQGGAFEEDAFPEGARHGERLRGCRREVVVVGWRIVFQFGCRQDVGRFDAQELRA